MSFVIGFIFCLGLIVSVYSILRNNKVIGIINLVLTIIAPIITYLFLQKKSSFVYGGSYFEFLIQTATVDKMIEPWLILVLYIIIIVLIIYLMITINKNKKCN